MRQRLNRFSTGWTLAAVCLVGLLMWPSLARRAVTVDSGHRQVMGTFAQILAVADRRGRAESAIDAAFDEIRRINARMNDYDPNSALSQVSRAAFAGPVPVEDDLFTVLKAARDYSELTGGAFDVTIGPVVQLWRRAKIASQAPAAAELDQARRAVGFDALILDPEARTVRFDKEGMALDLGGIAKGYAIDRAVDILKAAGVKGGMVDIGGDLRCFGTPAYGRRHWRIGLQNPTGQDGIVRVLTLDDRAVATSGDYRRSVVIGGQKRNHIVDPVTSDSARGFASVTVIAPTAMAADALATAVSVLGTEKGLALIEAIEDVEAILFEAGAADTPLQTPGAERYLNTSE